MIVHNLDPVFIDLGVLQIRWYSMAYIVGIILGWVYALKIIKEMARMHNLTMIKEVIKKECYQNAKFEYISEYNSE